MSILTHTCSTKEQRIKNPLSGACLAFVGLGCLLMISGCGSRAENRFLGAAGDQANGDWVCEAGKAADDWDCIQSENIEPILSELETRKAPETRQPSPEPQRTGLLDQPLPTLPALPPGNTPAASDPAFIPTTPQPIIDPNADTQPRPQPEPPLPEPPPPNGDGQASVTRPFATTASAQRPTEANRRPLTTAQAERAKEPSYAHYAYRPSEPVRIIDLPEEFYAAQLLAVSTKAQIEDFVVQRDLYNMSAARIEQDGQILYVLLLGVYESKDIALEAVQHMPQEVRALKPWVRPINGLQESMLRANRMMATASATQPNR